MVCMLLSGGDLLLADAPCICLLAHYMLMLKVDAAIAMLSLPDCLKNCTRLKKCTSHLIKVPCPDHAGDP